MALDKKGWEIPDPEPIAIPSGFKRPETLAEQVQRLVRTTLSRQAEAAGFETFEEAEDFEVDDDFDPSSPYETFFDPVLNREISPDEFQRNAERYRQQYADAHREYFTRVDRDNILAENLLRRAVKSDQEASRQKQKPSESQDEPPLPPPPRPPQK